jgi:hypothetical protein
MPITLDGTGSITGLTATGISAVQQLPNPAVVTTLNAPSGVLATQNGMTGIAKAWVNYDATTQTIRSSFNVSSVTYTSTGYFTVNLTTAMPNANYMVCGSASVTPGLDPYSTVMPFSNASTGALNTPTTTSFTVSVGQLGYASRNTYYVMLSVFSS